uniref:Zona pellucida sperm-binding protein 3 n=1 Tax=Scleropages formosus TaxID=113540 RepID=A0A8C9SLJ8_SCLFO
MARLQELVINLVLVPFLLGYYSVLPNGFSHQGLGVGAQHNADHTEQHGFTSETLQYNTLEEDAKGGTLNTVTVKCHASTMEIVVQADLYGVGTVIDVSELRLGANPHPRKSCRPTVSGHGEYTIIASLTDCGTKRLVRNSLIYVNLLIYSPSSSPEGIIRMKEVVIPVECYYPSSDALRPDPTLSSHQVLILHVPTGDWQSKRASNQYVSGEYINIEAMVRLHQPTALRLFIDNCVASLLPEKTSSPNYSFVENNGCLFDALMTGSRSAFLPRVQENKLQLQLESFRFDQKAKNMLYITCLLVAVPLTRYRNSDRRACSFIGGRWRSADGADSDCLTCEQSLWITHPLWASAPVASKLEKGFREKSKETSSIGAEDFKGMDDSFLV